MTTAPDTQAAPTWHGEIKDYFTPYDIEMMRQVYGFDLSSYSFVVSHAPDIYQRISLPPDAKGRMPKAPSDPWTAGMIARFLQWMENGYPEGTPQPKQMLKARAAVTGRVRKSLTELTPDEVARLKTAFTGMMNLSNTDMNGYFQNAAIHGLPLAYCQHHDPGFLPWHRVQLWAFENCMRLIAGCDDITLPYWDFSQPLPDWMYEAPFVSYTLPVDIGVAADPDNPDYKAGYKTTRNPAQQILDSFNQNVMQYFANAQQEKWWDNFNGLLDNTPSLDFIRGHDTGHNSTGYTMADQNISSFDPVFWFYHCNLDRMWWIWQANNEAQTLDGFMKTIQNKSSSSYMVFTNAAVGKMNPWAQTLKRDDLTAAYTIDLATNFDVSYDSMVLDLPQAQANKHRSLNMARFFTANDQEVDVRVSGLDRTKIPGTFTVHLLKDGKILDSSVFFQPNEVQKCSNCMKTPVVHFDFRLPLADIQGGQLSIWVEPNKKEMYGDTVPMKVLGDPRINVSLLVDAS